MCGHMWCNQSSSEAASGAARWYRLLQVVAIRILSGAAGGAATTISSGFDRCNGVVVAAAVAACEQDTANEAAVGDSCRWGSR